MSHWRRSLFSATFGQSVGRVATILTPLLVLFVHPADGETDALFLMLSISFYFAGTIANGLTDATLPLYKQYGYMPAPPAILGGALAIALSFGAGWVLWTPGDRGAYGLAGALIAFSGVAAAFPTARLYADSRYVAVGAGWLFRLVPLGMFVALPGHAWTPMWLALGFGLADVVRLSMIAGLGRKIPCVEARDFDGHVIRHYFTVIIGVMINGLNPLVDRAIAGLGGAGAISVLDLGERLYQVIGSLATVGFSPVALVYLSGVTRPQDAYPAWRRLVKLTMIWSVCWMLLGFIVLALLGRGFIAEKLQMNMVQTDQAIECCTYFLLGLPPLLTGSVCARQLIVSQNHGWLVIMAILAVIANGLVSYILFLVMGLPGIALGTAFVYLLTFLAMVLVLRRKFRQEAIEPVPAY